MSGAPALQHVYSDGNEHDWDNIPDVLLQPQFWYGTPVHYGAPVQLERQENYAAQMST